MNAETLSRIADDICQEQFTYADCDPAALIKVAAYEMARNEYADKVVSLMESAGYEMGTDPEIIYPGTFCIHFGVRLPDYCQPRGLSITIRSLHVSICAREGDRKRICKMLTDASMVDGYSGNPDDFEAGQSGYGWVSVR